jgi:hypothetical protein
MPQPQRQGISYEIMWNSICSTALQHCFVQLLLHKDQFISRRVDNNSTKRTEDVGAERAHYGDGEVMVDRRRIGDDAVRPMIGNVNGVAVQIVNNKLREA